VRIALLGGRFDREELDDAWAALATRRAGTAVTVQLNGVVTAVAAAAVEVDEAPAIQALACPVTVVRVDHGSPPVHAFKI
jgi:hypothetical protein